MDELMVIAPSDFPLMEARGAVHPERVEEWRSNLTSVRTMDDVTADYLAIYAA